MGRNEMKKTTAPIGAQNRGEARHAVPPGGELEDAVRTTVRTPTRAYGGDSRLRGDS